MIRRVFFDKPSIKVDIDKLPRGAIFFVSDEPYMKINEVKDNFDATVNAIHLRGGELVYWGNEDLEEFDIEYFPNHQNIKIVGD